MATFLDRCFGRGGYETDGDSVDIELFKSFLHLIIAGSFTAEQAHAYYNCTESQAAEMDEIIATIPQPLSDKLRWVDVTYSTLMVGKINIAGYQTNNEIRVKLGLAPL